MKMNQFRRYAGIFARSPFRVRLMLVNLLFHTDSVIEQ